MKTILFLLYVLSLIATAHVAKAAKVTAPVSSKAISAEKTPVSVFGADIHILPLEIYFFAAIASIFFALLLRKTLKRKRKQGKSLIKCPKCVGTGKITVRQKEHVDCRHCKGTGKDICHYCGGTGKIGVGTEILQSESEAENFVKCNYCDGKGFPKFPPPCCKCNGKKIVEFFEYHDESCPMCKGKGVAVI